MRNLFSILGVLAVASACNSTTSPVPESTTAYTVTTLAGSETEGSQDGKGMAATFSTPAGMVCDLQGNVYVADQYYGLIRKVTPDGTVTTVAGGGSGTLWSGNKDPLKAALKRPLYLSLAPNGSLLISETGDRSFDKTNLLFRVLSATNGVTNYVYTNPPPSFDNQQYANGGVVQDKAGNYYLLEVDHIRKITPQGGHIPNWVANCSWEGRPFTGNQFAIDTSGNLFFPTGGVDGLLKGGITSVTADGKLSYLQDGPVGSKIINGRLQDVDLGFVYLLTTDKQNNLYVVTSGESAVDNRIVKISPDNRVSFVAGGTGDAHIDGPGKTAQFQHITGIAVDNNGIIYVTDYGRIRKISPLK